MSVNASLDTRPRNVAEVVGNSVVLNCAADDTSPTIFWYEYITKSRPAGEAISNNDNVVHTSRADRYTITGDSVREFSLNIIATQTDDGGEYDCRLFSPTENAYAQVIVLGEAPQCESSAPGPVIEGTEVTYNCFTTYYGKWAPIMEWTATGTDLPTVDNSTDGTNVAYSFTVMTTPDDNGATFTCNTRFDQPQSVGQDEAANIPDYQHTCGPLNLEVQYKPRNIIRIPDNGDMTAGTEVKCQADANPGPIMYSWVDIETNVTVSTRATYTFPHDNLGERFLRCIASNTVDYATEDFNFTVAATTTTTTTTTTPMPTTTTGLSTTPTVGESSSTDKPGGSALGAGAIAGIAVAAAIVVAIIIIVIFWFVCRKSPKKDPDTRPSKPVPADAVRAPDVLGSKEPIYDNNDSPYNNANYYPDPRNKNAEGLVYADLALDDTPRSRKPIQVYEPTQYAEIQQRV